MKESGTKEITIESADIADIKFPNLGLKVHWKFETTSDDWDHEVTCPDIDKYIESYIALIRPVIAKAIQDVCSDLEWDNMPAEWAREAHEAREDAKGEAQYQDAKDRGEDI